MQVDRIPQTYYAASSSNPKSTECLETLYSRVESIEISVRKQTNREDGGK